METPFEKPPIENPEGILAQKRADMPVPKSVGINPVSKPERELSPQEREVLDFIESHKQPVTEALTQLIKGNRFVLVGEAHLEESEPVRREIAIALARLQQEGLTHIALEANFANQGIIDELDFSDPRINEILKEKRIAGVGWGEGNYDILTMAKRLGLKIVLIDYDDGRPDSTRDNAKWQNLRDSRMAETINGQIDDKAKVLIFIGSDHVHQREVQGYNDGKVKRLGARLVKQYGSETVKSVRYVGNTGRFDNLLGFMPKTPSPENISSGKKEVVVIPDQGPVKGDERVSAADYIITVI